MRAHQVHLQFTNLFTGDANIAEFPHSGCNSVGNLVACDQLVDYGASAFDASTRIGSKDCSSALDRNFADGFQRQIISVNVQGFHGLLPMAFLNASRYFAGSGVIFIAELVTTCVVSPSAN